MPLPTIETPTYELKLPSSNKKIKYRPFLVKEEKILILALESKNQDEITNAVTDVLKKCILTRGVDVDSLPKSGLPEIPFYDKGKNEAKKNLDAAGGNLGSFTGL